MIGYKGRKEGDEKRTGEVMREKVMCVMKRRRISQERKKVPEPDEMLLH